MSFVLTAQNGTALIKTSRTKIEDLVFLLEKDLINSLTFRFGSRLKTSCRKHAKNKQRTIKWAYIWVTTTQAELSLYVASRDNQLYNCTITRETWSGHHKQLREDIWHEEFDSSTIDKKLEVSYVKMCSRTQPDHLHNSVQT